MKNHRDLFGLLANLLIVAVVLAAIIIGLNKIGVYDLPDWAEKLLGTAEVGSETSAEDNSLAYENVGYDSDSTGLLVGNVPTYANAKQLLSAVKPDNGYMQEIIVVQNSSSSKLTQRMTVVNDAGLYEINILDEAGNLIKHIKEDGENINVIIFDRGQSSKYSLPKGDIAVWEECGVLLNSDNFLDSDYELENSEFQIVDSDYGTCAVIEFDSSFDGYSQREIYTVSLDYGVVLEAQCYENDTLVYSLETLEIANISG